MSKINMEELDKKINKELLEYVNFNYNLINTYFKGKDEKTDYFIEHSNNIYEQIKEDISIWNLNCN